MKVFLSKIFLFTIFAFVALFGVQVSGVEDAWGQPDSGSNPFANHGRAPVSTGHGPDTVEQRTSPEEIVSGPSVVGGEVSARNAEAVAEKNPGGNFNPSNTHEANLLGSAILLDSVNLENKRYPDFAYLTPVHEDGDIEKQVYRSLVSVHLGVDNEILKRHMPLFTSIDKMKRSHLNSEHLRDKYLNMFESVRAIAVLTLSYLDKTVGAGLATVEQQTQLRATNNLLKTLNYGVAKMANPHWAHVIDDNQEKIVQCMVDEPLPEKIEEPEAENGHELVTSKRYSNLTDKKYFEACKAECGEPPLPKTANYERQGDEGNELNVAISRYDFCVCCAELNTAPNEATDLLRPYESGGWNGSYSVVERLFFGSDGRTFFNKVVSDLTGIPVVYDDLLELEKAGSKGVGRDVINLAQDFKETYGDIVIVKNDKVREIPGGPEGKEVGVGAGMVLKVVPPSYSPQNLVAKYRDGCITNKTGGCNDFERKQGICPALFHLLSTIGRTDEGLIKSDSKGMENLSQYQRLRRLAYELASRGGISLTAGDIKQILQKDNIISSMPLPLVEVENDTTFVSWDFVGNRKKNIVNWANNFCDVSAIAYFRRVHNRMSSLVIDALALNTSISENHKRKLLALLNRVGQYFALAEGDSQSNHYVKNLLESLHTESSRRSVSDTNSILEGLKAGGGLSGDVTRSNPLFGGP